MVVINADDWGSETTITNRILDCVECKKVDSVSAMVFMKDSRRAAELAIEKGIDTGLHLNFTLSFTAEVPGRLLKFQSSIISFLKKHKLAQVLYNPFIKNEFAYVYQKQVEEYSRLYKKEPSRIDGHNHMHLCANVIWGQLIPQNTFVRRNYSFLKNEKNFWNKKYRAVIDSIIRKRYHCTDYFFHIQQFVKSSLIKEKIKNLLKNSISEVLVHPNQEIDYNILNSTNFQKILSGVPRCRFDKMINNRNRGLSAVSQM